MSGSFNPDIHVPGLWRCAKCGFVLIQSNLNAQDGAVTARDDAGDRCPNDGAPLWRVTWKEHAHEIDERAEEQQLRAMAAEARIAELEAGKAEAQDHRLEYNERNDIVVYVVWALKPNQLTIVAICTSELISQRYKTFVEQFHRSTFYVEPVYLNHAFGRRDVQSAIYNAAIRNTDAQS